MADKLLRFFVLLISYLPMGLSRAIGKGLGRLAFCLDKRHRKIIIDNIRQSFPDKDEDFVDYVAKSSYAHVGQVLLEIPHLLRLSPEKIVAKTRFHGMDPKRHKKVLETGGFMLTCHIGNWEWASVATGYNLFKAGVVARPIDWPPADRLVNSWRTKTGHEVVPKAKSARRILNIVRKKGFVGILLDQNVDWYDGEWVDFFGRPACTNKGLALLAMRTKAPVIPYYCFRADDGCFDVYFGPDVELVETSDKTKDVWQNTQNYTKVLENIVREKPEQWFWLHQRWKTKPFHKWPRENN